MPIALPPPLPPLLSEAAAMQNMGEAAFEVTHGGVRYQIRGPAKLTTEDLQAAIARTSTPSDAVRALVDVARYAGFPAARVLYAPIDAQSVLAVIVPSKVTAVEAPAALQGYFQGLTDHAPLTDTALEPRRAFAGFQSDRLGYVTNPQWVLDGNDVRLDLRARQQQRPDGAKVEIGNPGTRFTGTVLLDVAARRADRWGNEYALTMRDSHFYKRDYQDGAYHEQGISASHAFPTGLLTTGARHVLFRQNFAVDDVRGRIFVADLAWMTIPYASFQTRVTTSLKADYTRKVSFLTSNRTLIQDEPYPSLEAGAQLTQRSVFFDQEFEWDASLVYRGGLGSQGNEITAADLDYQMARSAWGIKLNFAEEYSLSVQAAGQYSPDTVPEQQQWVLGGIGTLHAWYPGALAGDSGWLVRTQVDYSGWKVNNRSLAPAAFMEYGGAQTNASGVTQSLADVGIGLNLLAAKNWSASFASAVPILEDDDGIASFSPRRIGVFVRLAGFWQ